MLRTLASHLVPFVIIGLPVAVSVPAQADEEVEARLERIERLVAGMHDRSGAVVVVPPSSSPGVAYATSSMDCGGTKYEVSTGNEKGSCKTSFGSNGEAEEVSCTDGKGNAATVHCSAGAMGCGSVGGSGSCKIQK